MAAEAEKTVTEEQAQVEERPFQTEVQQLLKILIHSLYTDKEIFLRELISNASDALDKIRFRSLTDRNIVDPDAELKIDITVDKSAKTMTIRDTGIGMNREEANDIGCGRIGGVIRFSNGLDCFCHHKTDRSGIEVLCSSGSFSSDMSSF